MRGRPDPRAFAVAGFVGVVGVLIAAVLADAALLAAVVIQKTALIVTRTIQIRWRVARAHTRR
jgi:hypothetical protein